RADTYASPFDFAFTTVSPEQHNSQWGLFLRLPGLDDLAPALPTVAIKSLGYFSAYSSIPFPPALIPCPKQYSNPYFSLQCSYTALTKLISHHPLPHIWGLITRKSISKPFDIRYGIPVLFTRLTII